MILTRSFRETVVARAGRDRRFRQSMLTKAISELLSSDVEAGKFLLRDYINATITFDGLAAVPDKPSKSLQRRLAHAAIPPPKISLPYSKCCKPTALAFNDVSALLFSQYTPDHIPASVKGSLCVSSAVLAQ